MKIAISGASGFIGKRLSKKFNELGFIVVSLSRSDFEKDIDSLVHKLSDTDIVINLAGANIAKRWTKAYKQVIYESRIQSTQMLVNAINKMEVKPKLLLSASAIGIYDALNQHDENSIKFADNFLSVICRDWEKEAFKAVIPTVILRFSVVLDRNEGAFPKMFLPFKFGLGGKIGSGKQWFSWIYIDDLVNAVIHIIKNDSRSIIYNIVSPESITNIGFTEILSKKIRKPALFSVPSFVLKIFYGEGAVIMLEGQNVIPNRLIGEGFVFNYSKFDKVLDILI